MKNHDAEVPVTQIPVTQNAEGSSAPHRNLNRPSRGLGERSKLPDAPARAPERVEGRTEESPKRVLLRASCAVTLALPLLLASCAPCRMCNHPHDSPPQTAAADSKSMKHPAPQSGEKGSAAKQGAKAKATPMKPDEWAAPRAEYPPSHPTPPRWR